MNATKARDFFSAYYEGDLTGGIKEAFERALADDPGLKSEYDEFCSTMRLLDEPSPDVEIPADLHDKIMARLDMQAWEEKQNEKVSIWGQWRLALIGGLAVVALVAAVAGLNNRSASQSTATPVPIPGNPVKKPETVDLNSKDGKLTIVVSNAVDAEFSLRQVSDNSELGQIEASGGSVTSELQNDSEEARAYAVFNKGGEEKLLIVLPGSRQGDQLKGNGSVTDLAVAVAGVFRTPIIIRAADREKLYSWDFDKSDDTATLSSKLSDQGLSLSVREDGISLLSAN